jgi:phosphatidylglycerol:prolipoprotein diacylglycerol transferase
MPGPFVHNIDPVIGSVSGVHLWWYGLAYSLGFLTIFFALRRKQQELGFTERMVYDLAILAAMGVLLGGRFIEVVFYEWPFYSKHLHLIPACWLGGMATHGLLLGGMVAVVLYCRIHRLPVLVLTDALAVPAAFILGFGRIGNFIDGQIVGSPTDGWWGVKFPDAEGYRHPVVLYDGAKNFLLVPLMMYMNRLRLAPGATTGLFLFLYALLRVFIDVFREYPTTLLGLATGQVLNLGMSAAGLVLLVWALTRVRGRSVSTADAASHISMHDTQADGLSGRLAIFSALLVVSLVIPSDWTQDIPERYGKRHRGLHHSALYPPFPELIKP